jgi:hypothetical protein
MLFTSLTLCLRTTHPAEESETVKSERSPYTTGKSKSQTAVWIGRTVWVFLSLALIGVVIRELNPGENERGPDRYQYRLASAGGHRGKLQ